MNKCNVIKFQAPFESLKDYDFTPETKLFKSIIIQAIIDISNNADNYLLKQFELEAKNWLFGNSEHFLHTCKLAELEQQDVVKMARAAIMLNDNLKFYFTHNKPDNKPLFDENNLNDNFKKLKIS